MAKNKVKNVVIAVGVVVGLDLVIGFVEGASGISFGSFPYILSTILGGLTYRVLQVKVQEVRADESARQAALNAAAPGGQAVLYVYREGLLSKFAGWNVTLDGVALAQLVSPRFTQTMVPAGTHKLGVTFPTLGVKGSQPKPCETTFQAKPQEVLVFALKPKVGRIPAQFVRHEDAAAARLKLARIPMVVPQDWSARPESAVTKEAV